MRTNRRPLSEPALLFLLSVPVALLGGLVCARLGGVDRLGELSFEGGAPTAWWPLAFALFAGPLVLNGALGLWERRWVLAWQNTRVPSPISERLGPRARRLLARMRARRPAARRCGAGPYRRGRLGRP